MNNVIMATNLDVVLIAFQTLDTPVGVALASHQLVLQLVEIGVRASSEQCDNGNQLGCGSDCVPDSGYTCTENEGEFSTCTTVCGDGVRTSSEQCDNGNQPGCGSDCLTDTGYTCSGSVWQSSTCTLGSGNGVGSS